MDCTAPNSPGPVVLVAWSRSQGMSRWELGASRRALTAPTTLLPSWIDCHVGPAEWIATTWSVRGSEIAAAGSRNVQAPATQS